MSLLELCLVGFFIFLVFFFFPLSTVANECLDSSTDLYASQFSMKRKSIFRSAGCSTNAHRRRSLFTLINSTGSALLLPSRTFMI